MFSALLSAGLGVFTTDVWCIDHDWLPAAHPAAPVSLPCVCGSVPLAQPRLLGRVLPSLAQAFPGARPFPVLGCGRSRQMLPTEAAPSALAACYDILTPAPRQALSVTGEGFIPVLQHLLLLTVGTSLAFPWLRWMLCCCWSPQAAVKATCGTLCGCQSSREEQLCLQALSSLDVLAKQQWSAQMLIDAVPRSFFAHL